MVYLNEHTERQKEKIHDTERSSINKVFFIIYIFKILIQLQCISPFPPSNPSHILLLALFQSHGIFFFINCSYK